MDETPVLRQLLLCEKIIFEQGTGNPTLINVHSARKGERFPARLPPFILFGLLTDGSGTFTMQVRVTRLENAEDVYEKSEPLLLTDRLKEVQYLFRFNDIVIPAAGHYQVMLLANGEVLGMTTLAVKQKG